MHIPFPPYALWGCTLCCHVACFVLPVFVFVLVLLFFVFLFVLVLVFVIVFAIVLVHIRIVPVVLIAFVADVAFFVFLVFAALMALMIVVVLAGLALIPPTTVVLPIHATGLLTGQVKDKSSQVFFSTVWVIHCAYPLIPPIQCCHDGEPVFPGGRCALQH